MKKITLQITTKNRAKELQFTLDTNKEIINDVRVHTIICIDGVEDEAYSNILSQYPNIQLLINEKSIGVISSRNLMMSITKTPYSISLDDDAHFLSLNTVDQILEYFKLNSDCAVMAFRIYWGIDAISFIPSNEQPSKVQGFVGCGHAWRLSSWNSIPEYPNWFFFHGEEEFASYQLFKKKLSIHYVPNIFVQHRVDRIRRLKDKDFYERYRMSLRSGYYVWFMFMPLSKIPRLVLSSFLAQLRNRLIKGEWFVLRIYLLILWDIIYNFNRIISSSNRLSHEEFSRFEKIPPTKIGWKFES
jgi:hypothetical protein